MSLNEEIRQNLTNIYTTDITMSIGEIISMYRDYEIIIKPEYQRFFRWSIEQKSRFIESILIGIPIPSIFVQQLENGKWEVIDGMQRISTILEFTGFLIDDNNELYPRSELVKTKFLPSLEGMTYESFEEKENQKISNKYFDNETKLIFKRARLLFQVIKRDSNTNVKYELFDRLHSSVTPLTDQEIRSAIFLSEKPEAIRLIKELKDNEDFINTTNLSDRNIDEAYNEELVLRFFAYSHLVKNYEKFYSVKEFLDEFLERKFDVNDIPNMKANFKKFFNFLNNNFETKVFKGKRGGFTISKFEVLTVGLTPYLNDLDINKNLFIEKINNLDNQEWFMNATIKGFIARKRLEAYIENAPKYFKV